MKTREKILLTALRLFNEKGIDVITIRHIAKEMGISHSNIQYYFKNADEIISTIYTNHIEELDELVVFENNTLQALHESIVAVLTHIYHYRFIYIHFVVIVRRMPEIKKLYNKRFQYRKQQFLQLFKIFRQQGIFRDDIPAPVWESLITNMYVVGDFWISSNELSVNLKGKKAVEYYTELVTHIFYPFLTAQGRQVMAATLVQGASAAKEKE